MFAFTLIVIGVFFLGFGALLATRRRYVWAAISTAAAILCALLIFWSTSEISEDESDVTPVSTVPATPAAAQRKVLSIP